MRNLTITRQKNFVGCAAAMNIFIGDPNYNDIVFNGESCRMLGSIKNGETVTFPIPEDTCRIYIVAGMSPKNACRDMIVIRGGFDDVTLTGKNHYNPILGNPFRFDNEPTEEVKAFRKSGNRLSYIIFAIALLVGIGLGFYIGFNEAHAKDPKIYTTSFGYSIELQKDFEVSDNDADMFSGGNDTFGCNISAEDLTDTDYEGITVEQYASFVNEMFECNGTYLTLDEMYALEYDSNDGSFSYKGLIFFLKEGNEYIMCEFICAADDYASCKEQFTAWAKTLKKNP